MQRKTQSIIDATLCKYVKENDYDKVKFLLLDNDSIDLNRTDTNDDGFTLLYLAARNGQTDIVELLCQQPQCLVDELSQNGVTPLYIACEKGHLDIVKILVRHKAKINRPTYHNATPIFVAASNGRIDIIDFLLRFGADPNARCENGYTPLHFVSSKLDFNTAKPIIDLFIKMGANPYAVCVKGRKLSDYAIDPEVEKYLLLLEQPYLNISGPINFIPEEVTLNFCSSLPPLTLGFFGATCKANWAITRANSLWKPIVLKMFSAKASGLDHDKVGSGEYYQINRKTMFEHYQNFTSEEKKCVIVAHFNDLAAIAPGNVQFKLETLYKQDAKKIEFNTSIRSLNYLELNKTVFNHIRFGKGKDWHAPLVRLALILDQNNKFVIDLLLHMYSSINEVYIQGRNILYLAVLYNSFQFLKVLIEMGADFKRAYGAQSHPLYLAVQEGHYEIVDYLLSKGAQTQLQFHGWTALSKAAELGHHKIVERLLNAGADINCHPNPLILAIQNNKTEVIKILLAHGADTTIRDNERNLLRIAAENNNIDAVLLLLEHYQKNQIQHPNCLVDARTLGVTPLRVACFTGCFKIAQALIAHGADVNSLDPLQAAPLMKAAQFGYRDIVDLLLANGADPNLRCKYGYTPLHYVCVQLTYVEAKPIITSLIRAGIDPKAVSSRGNTYSNVAENFKLKELMLTLESIANKCITDIVYVNPVFSTKMEWVIDDITQSFTINQIEDKNIAKIYLRLMQNVFTPFGLAVILFSILDQDVKEQNSLFSEKDNEFVKALVHALGFKSKGAAKSSLHTMIWDSLSKNIDLYIQLKVLIIFPITEGLEEGRGLSPDDFYNELLYLNVFEARVKKSYELQMRYADTNFKLTCKY